MKELCELRPSASLVEEVNKIGSEARLNLTASFAGPLYSFAAFPDSIRIIVDRDSMATYSSWEVVRSWSVPETVEEMKAAGWSEKGIEFACEIAPMREAIEKAQAEYEAAHVAVSRTAQQ